MPDTATASQMDDIGEPLDEEIGAKADGPKKSGGLLSMLLIMAAMQIVMAVGAFFFVRSYLTPRLQLASGMPVEENAAPERGDSKIHMIDDIVVNPAGTNGTRYLSTSIGLEYKVSKEKGHEAGLESVTPVIRDVLIALLTSKTMDQLSSIEGKEKLREEILTNVNTAIKPDSVYRIYFVDYVLQ